MASETPHKLSVTGKLVVTTAVVGMAASLTDALGAYTAGQWMLAATVALAVTTLVVFFIRRRLGR